MNQDSLEKWSILGLGQEIYKMSLEHLMVTEIEKVLKHTHNDRGYVKGARGQMKES